MTLSEIQSAVRSGKTVCWKNPGYVVLNPKGGAQWLVVFTPNGYCNGLFRLDTGELIGNPDDFYILDDCQ